LDCKYYVYGLWHIFTPATTKDEKGLAILKIVKFPQKVLKTETKVITNHQDSYYDKLIKDMAETMYDAPGIGLAANQVGLSLRLAVIDISHSDENKEKDLKVFFNPKIIEQSDLIEFEEGCLSLPGITAKTNRFNKITVEYEDQKKNKQTIKADGLLAVALQHEIGHLDGFLYIDQLGPLKKEMAIKKYKKLQHEPK
jgi:peptide deformylase